MLKKVAKIIYKINGTTRLSQQLIELQKLVEEIKSKHGSDIGYTHTQLENLKQQLTEFDQRSQKRNELFFAALYRKPNESDLKMWQRFFRSLPQATDKLRAIQLHNTELLQELVKVCKKHKIKYWLDCGTLIGAVRHNGCIPWDDDIDLGMLRDDLDKLLDVMKDHLEYQITLVYDYYNKSRQYRFRSRNTADPCFVDIFIYDYANNDSEETWREFIERKQAIVRLFEQNSSLMQQWEKTPWVDSNSDFGKKLTVLYDKYYKNNPYEEKSNSKALIWGLDNPIPELRGVFAKEQVFPLTTAEYEQCKYSCPCNSERYLQTRYGDIYKLPDDLVSHYKHVEL